MFDHLLESSSDDEAKDDDIAQYSSVRSDETIVLPVFSNTSPSRRSSVSVPPSQHSMRTALNNFIQLINEDDGDDDANVVQTVEEAGLQRIQSRASSTSNISSNVSSNVNDEIILSLIYNHGRLGGAYYNTKTSEIFIMNDIHDDDFNFTMTKAVYWQCLPKTTITVKGTSMGFQKALEDTIIKNCFNGNRADGASSESSTSAVHGIELNNFKRFSKKDCSFEHCQYRVRNLKLDSEPPGTTMQERSDFLDSLLNFQSQSMIYALGLLLIYIDRNWNAISLSTTQAKFLAVNNIILNDMVYMNEDAYEILAITRSRQHPSVFRFGNQGDSKVVNNLYSLYNQCQSKVGSQCLWRILRHPIQNISIIKSRLNVIEFFMNTGNQVIAKNLMTCLAHVHSISPTILNKVTALNTKPLDWRKLYDTLCNVILIGEICYDNKKDVDIFEKVAESVTEKMHYIKYFIDYIIDFEMSSHTKKMVVKQGVDPTLDELLGLKERLPSILSEVGEKEVEDLPPGAETCRMLYFPDICFVLAITKWKDEAPEDVEIPGMEFKFQMNGIRHYKTHRAKELDETIGDVHMKINNRQTKMMTRLVRYIIQNASDILNAVRRCAELDVLLSFYTVALECKYVKPNMVDSQIIDVKKGRHPIQEQLDPNFVPNDIFSGGEKSLVKVLTGPNACGKSMYLKQVALIVFMAHIGSYVPAESATIGIMKHIFIQMTIQRSYMFDMSLFGQDMQQIIQIVRMSTANSLVIIDEFGKHTNEIDGVALLAAILTDLIERESNCPHVFASTHLFKVLNLIPRNNLVEMQTFEYIEDNGNISFLYRIISGSTTSSFAHSVAKLCGFDDKFIKDSLQVLEHIKKGAVPPSFNQDLQEIYRMSRELVCYIRDTKKIEMEEVTSRIDSIIKINDIVKKF